MEKKIRLNMKRKGDTNIINHTLPYAQGALNLQIYGVESTPFNQV